MIHECSFEDCSPIFSKKWPENHHFQAVENTVGQVEWSVHDMHKADPRFYLYTINEEAVAAMCIFRAADNTGCIRAWASTRDISNGEWRELFAKAFSQIRAWGCNRTYAVCKEADFALLTALGFTGYDGPYWTNDWKVYIGWKDFDDRNRFGDTCIATDVDGQGNPLKIWYSNTVGGSKAAWLIAKVYGELLEKDFSGPYANFEDIYKNCNVVYSTDLDGNLMGGMVFEYREAGKEGFQHLNFVHPDHRGKRISSVSRKYHRKLIKERGGNKIASTIMVDNASSLKTALRDDMKLVYVRMHKWL